MIEALPGYEVGEEIGRGGWGVVLEASHRSLERRVAVKSLPRAFGADPDVRARFLAEARVVAALDHPHIVPLYDFVEHEGLCLLVMELMPGGTLWDRFSGGDLSPEQACAVTLAVLTGLDHAHGHGILHRDVKPENVLFNAAGVPKLADFGIAKVVGDSSSQRTATGVVMGTPAYMAPEQGSGKALSPATDVYAVGAMLYELMTGRLPFESTGDALSQLYRHVHEQPRSVHEIAATVPGPVADVIMRALEKEPDARFESAVAFARALDRAAAEGFGLDWLQRSEIPVLAARSTLGLDASGDRGRSRETVVTQVPLREPPSTPPPAAATPPPSAAQLTGSASATDGAGPAPPAVPAEPAAVSGAFADPAPAPAVSTPAASTPEMAAATAAGPAPPVPVPSPPSAAPERSGPSIGLIAAVVAVLAAVAVVAFVAFPRGGGDEVAADEAPALEEVPAATIERFETTCLDSGVPPELCRCVTDTALDELSVTDFIAAEQVLNRDGDSLTAELESIFGRCQDELDTGA